MAATLDQVAEQIISTLRVTDPELDTSVGTSTRKIIDAVAYSIANAYVEQHMTSYQYDIDSKAGADLDAFTQLFGIARLAAKRASGAVTFTRGGATDVVVVIPAGTEISTTGIPASVVRTIVSASMVAGQTTISIPVQAVSGGLSGNVAAGGLTQLASPVINIASVTNPLPITGGTDSESDSELRQRWKSTVFRSLAGTEQMYRGIALADNNCTSVTVLGSSKRRRERVQIASNAATSQVVDATYVYPTNVFVGKDIAAGDLAVKDVDYTWNATVPPTITGVNATTLPNGTVVDLDFEYVSNASRNNPALGIASKIDVWVAGVRPVTAVQSLVWKSSMPAFNTTGGDPMNVTNFVTESGANPTSGNKFVPLSYGPIVSVPDTITWGGQTWGRQGATTGLSAPYANAYRVVHEDTVAGYTPSSRFGLEWLSGSFPTTNSVATIGANDDYVYNEVPTSVQVEVDRWRLVGTDALVHQGRAFPLRFNLAVMYDGTQDTSEVNTSIDSAITRYLTERGMGATIQASDILQVVHNVPGVDAVRFLDASDIVGYSYASRNTYNIGIQLVRGGSVTATYITTAGRCQDVILSDSQNPVFESAVKVIKAQNTFGG
jgi:uncharacterized phage protein gp47/JayE